MGQLSYRELLGKTKSPIIINGKLLTSDRFIVCARKPEKAVEFLYTDSTQTEHPIANGKELIDKALADFMDRYAALNIKTDTDDVDVSICPYTGALIITSADYRFLSDTRRHDLSVHYEKQVRDLLNQFLFEEICNSFEIFYKILNPKLKRAQFPPMIKGHLVAGFYQPIICDTDYIKSAVRYPTFQSYISELLKYSKVLCSASDTTRKIKLNLTVIATADYCSILNMHVLPALQTQFFMLAVYYILAVIMDLRDPVFDDNKQLAMPHAKEFTERNQKLFNFIYSARQTQLRVWFEEFVNGSNNLLRKGL